jgi:hypothetical protein
MKGIRWISINSRTSAILALGVMGCASKPVPLAPDANAATPQVLTDSAMIKSAIGRRVIVMGRVEFHDYDNFVDGVYRFRLPDVRWLGAANNGERVIVEGDLEYVPAHQQQPLAGVEPGELMPTKIPVGSWYPQEYLIVHATWKKAP